MIKNNDNDVPDIKHDIIDEFLIKCTDLTISSGISLTKLPLYCYNRFILKCLKC